MWSVITGGSPNLNKMKVGSVGEENLLIAMPSLSIWTNMPMRLARRTRVWR